MGEWVGGGFVFGTLSKLRGLVVLIFNKRKSFGNNTLRPAPSPIRLNGGYGPNAQLPNS